MPELNASEWDGFLSGYPDAHLLQTSAWGELKSAFGWQVARLQAEEAGAPVGAQVLFRPLLFGLTLAYIAKGPVSGDGQQAESSHWDCLWPEVDALCRRRKAVFLKVEPDLWECASPGEDGPATPVKQPPSGFQLSQQNIQPQRTLLVDLCGDEEQVLARMKQKTRYNIRLALKKGVVVYPSSDLDVFYRLMKVTGQRDVFGVHSPAYYRKAYELFHSHGECELFVAEFEGQPLASLIVFARGMRAWYFYGASANEQRERMPTYLLQWEAMRWARRRGCRYYDLWGVPDAGEKTLETNFADRSGGLWGVYRFKRGFGGLLCRSLGPWDRIYQPVFYKFYRWWVQRRPQE